VLPLEKEGKEMGEGTESADKEGGREREAEKGQGQVTRKRKEGGREKVEVQSRASLSVENASDA